MKTYSAKASEIEKKWILIDAEDVVLGRLAVQVATILKGKNKTTYTPLMTTLGIDVVVSPRAITASTILQHVRRGRIRSVHSLRDGFAEVIEAEALETTSLVGTPLKDARLPSGVIVGALVRQDAVVIPRPDTEILKGDNVILLASAESVKQVEKTFAVGLEYF